MSFSTTTDRVTLAGNGATVAFSFPYILFATADLKVYLKNNTTGAETLQTITTHYTISGTLTNGVYESGATVTFLTAPTAIQTVLIYRDRDVTQELDLDDNAKIPATSLEKQLDKFATYIQRVKNKLSRTVGLPEGYSASFDTTLPAIVENSAFISTNQSGTGFIYTTLQSIINTISLGSQLFTANRVIVSNLSGSAIASSTTDTEVGYVSGVTSAIQTQLNSKVDESFGIINDTLSFTNQGSDPAAPSSGFTNTYTKSTGLFYRTPTNIRQVANLDEAQTFTGLKTLQNAAFTTNPLDLQVGQIKFPATDSPSADANTLDDYEEGTFTPIIIGTITAGTGTYTTRFASYTKFGNTVRYNIYILYTNLTGATGSLAVGGLPFISNSTTYNYNPSALYCGNIALTASNVLTAYVDVNTTLIVLTQYPVGGGVPTSVPIDTAGEIMVSGTYTI